ncbi:MAG TPA: 4'-phosphopantetheinyl transferase superfamily protein [Desulfosarcina sp.]|nr:4'-phosphopantetheinyl transferase superfamily protein [Desulfosarcina sp.]
MIPAPTTLHPVILPVPRSEQDLKGRDKVHALSRRARLALARSCRLSGLRLDALPKNDRGAPLPVDGVYWSLSHKSDVVGGVAAPLPIGLDLETVRPVSEALMAKIADRVEWRLTEESRLPLFFRFWTAKEAVLKAVGAGIAGLSRCRIREVVDAHRMILTFDDHPWPVAHTAFGPHLAAVTVHHLDVHWSVDH